MKPREFFDEVAKLRNLQKTYLKMRTSTVLAACKRQEKLIDEEIAHVNKQVEKDGQLRLM